MSRLLLLESQLKKEQRDTVMAFVLSKDVFCIFGITEMLVGTRFFWIVMLLHKSYRVIPSMIDTVQILSMVQP
jgi:hypothetical protein